MKLPRWTVYPALALIASLIVTAVPHAGDESQVKGAAKKARAAFHAQSDLSSGRVELLVEDPEQQDELEAGIESDEQIPSRDEQ